MVTEALGPCATLASITAELGLSGRVGTAKLRGRLQAGFATPDRIRLEAVAPFGAPFFIVAGEGGRATMWLPRDARVLRDAAPSAILDALAGLAVDPDHLGAWLAGCPAPRFRAQGAQSYGTDWVKVNDDGRTAWLRRTGVWRLVRTDDERLHIEFADHRGTVPGRIRIQRDAVSGGPPLDVRLAVSQVETNVTLPDTAFHVDVPSDATPMTLDELRASGPLREVTSGHTP
jgi:hypothetical protein